jgi:hypothetical protein
MLAQPAPHPNRSAPASWSFRVRLTFRFCFVYFGLFSLANCLGGMYPVLRADDEIGLAPLWPMRQITFWIAHHLFSAKLPLVYRESGSDDKTFDWVLVFWLLILSISVTGVWSMLDRRRPNYDALHKWFRQFILLVLASELFMFGVVKVMRVQMGFPSLAALVRPLGSLSRYALLWVSIGGSPGYEIFAGCAEVAAGVLLLFPRTTMLGALLAVADMTEVWTLNMTYDVPVKLFSFHLLLLALVILAPESQRLIDFALRNRSVEPSNQLQLFQESAANRIALGAQILFGVGLLVGFAHMCLNFRHIEGDDHPKSPLYGIWNVDNLSLQSWSTSRPTIDPSRWRRAIFEYPDWMLFQGNDDTSFERYSVSIAMSDQTIHLINKGPNGGEALFHFERQAKNLVLDGEISGRKAQMELHPMDVSKLNLVRGGFHWIQEH